MAVVDAIDIAGFQNLFANGLENIKKVIEDNQSSLKCGRLKQIYSDDVVLPLTPSIAIMFTGSEQTLRSASNLTRLNYKMDLRYDLWYYHSELNDNTRREDITEILWQITSVLMVNTTLNCFVPKLGSVVEVATYRPRMRGGGVIMASALITLVAYKLHTINNAK